MDSTKHKILEHIPVARLQFKPEWNETISEEWVAAPVRDTQQNCGAAMLMKDDG